MPRNINIPFCPQERIPRELRLVVRISTEAQELGWLTNCTCCRSDSVGQHIDHVLQSFIVSRHSSNYFRGNKAHTLQPHHMKLLTPLADITKLKRHSINIAAMKLKRSVSVFITTSRKNPGPDGEIYPITDALPWLLNERSCNCFCKLIVTH